jgi:asparagine synthase (glutamine-hydrolysing)
MFAIAAWNTQTSTLHLIRDRFGKKPLLYSQTPDGGIIFGSEARALLAAGASAEPDLNALNSVLAWGYVPTDRSGFSSIQSVPPASILTWRGGQVKIERYWALDLQSVAQWDLKEAQSACFAALDEAVRLRLVSERPLGAYLSGGIDSTVVTALMARHHAGPVKTFTIGFHDAAYDESVDAAEIARYLGTDHHTMIVEPDPVAFLEDLGSAFDQPFADSSAIPTLLVNQYASESVTVALTGDGGDEAFAGYDRYRAAPLLQRLNPLLHIAEPFGHVVQRYAGRRGDRRLGRIAGQLRPAKSLEDRYASLMTLVSSEDRSLLWTESARNKLHLDRPDSWFRDAWQSALARNEVERMVATDISTYLPGDLLVKADISSMANSIEVRSPMLDHIVVETAAQVPSHLRIQGSSTKHILRSIAQQLVPADLIVRPKKGFAIPRAAWLRGPLRDMTRDLLTGESARERDWFRPQAVETILNEHDAFIDRDEVIWPLLMIELWAQRWVD